MEKGTRFWRCLNGHAIELKKGLCPEKCTCGAFFTPNQVNEENLIRLTQVGHSQIKIQSHSLGEHFTLVPFFEQIPG